MDVSELIESDEDNDSTASDEETFLSCSSDILPLEMPPFIVVGYQYLEIIFNPNRGGFADVAENIVQYLNYHDLIHLKRSCSIMYNYFKQFSYLENTKLVNKLEWDGKRFGELENYTIPTPGLVSCASIFPDNNQVVVGIDQVVHVIDIRKGTGKLLYVGYTGLSINVRMATEPDIYVPLLVVKL